MSINCPQDIDPTLNKDKKYQVKKTLGHQMLLCLQLLVCYRSESVWMDDFCLQQVLSHRYRILKNWQCFEAHPNHWHLKKLGYVIHYNPKDWILIHQHRLLHDKIPIFPTKWKWMIITSIMCVEGIWFPPPFLASLECFDCLPLKYHTKITLKMGNRL